MRFFAEPVLSVMRFFATLRMTGSEGLRMTVSEGARNDVGVRNFASAARGSLLPDSVAFQYLPSPGLAG